jgi:membrane complex biogenesis BtpA family protein
MDKVREWFGEPKAVIAMAHFPALPGTPRYDSRAGIAGTIERVHKDVKALLDGGVDAIMFCNEDDRPYSFDSNFESVAVMTTNAIAPLAIAKATGAAFIREVVTGAYESDMGLWAPDAAGIYRYRRQIDAESVRIFANITPEFASPLGHRSVAQRARSAVVSSLVDAILIAGPMASAEPDYAIVKEAKDALTDEVPVFLNTGAKIENIRQFLSIADGVIVGSSLKVDGMTWNPVDPARVKAFMSLVRDIRK